MQKNVFEPLGMHDTRFYDSAEIIRAMARGYTIDNKGGLRVGYYASNSYSRWGDMGIISTARDMALWTKGQLDSSRAESYTYSEMTVRFYGSAAIVIGREATTGTGVPFQGRVTHVWAKRQGRLRLEPISRLSGVNAA